MADEGSKVDEHQPPGLFLQAAPDANNSEWPDAALDDLCPTYRVEE